MKFQIKSCALIVTLGLAILTFIAGSAYANPAPALSPLKEVEGTINALVQVVEAFPGEDKLSQRRAKLREVITPKFDFREMAKRSLGAHWKERSDEERDEFVRLFSDLLAKIYLDRIENVRANMVKVNSESVKEASATVKTMVNYKDDEFPIDYKLLPVDGRWKVYDVLIENIGLVVNYRNEFAGIIRKEQFEGLLKRLREKTAVKS